MGISMKYNGLTTYPEIAGLIEKLSEMSWETKLCKDGLLSYI